ncbi:branched-chain amino acid transport system II carrier protein [Salinicoccus jeotgali]|uniref:Branched-chain amino acid transport system carrier protein n=1 Tax=Salinicoccus jeotgali TaxID=381634 RepID=A0ABP7E7C9_9STAP
MKRSNIIFAGFMLFSLFFGAGNLIFPPLLGMEAGDGFGPAIIGFLITGVLLPIMAIVAVALSEDGLVSMGQRVHPVFGVAFAVIIYMSIGAFYGIPRASSVAYELGFKQIFNVESSLVLAIFSIVFFGITYLISLNPKKIVDRIGQYLTPLLLLVLSVLVVRAFFTFENPGAPAAEKYTGSPLVTGILEGYFTMDAVAALAFGIVIINALKDKGAETKGELVKGTFGAVLIAGLGLVAVYFSLGWIGRVIPGGSGLEDGAEILTHSANLLFPAAGGLLFGIIVLLACLTTCVGLISACSRFFNEIYPNIAYSTYAGIFVLIGLLVSNLGLDLILELALPLLVFIYPIAIVLIVLSLVERVTGESRKMYQAAVFVTAVYALYEVLISIGIESETVSLLLGQTPFFEQGLGWMVPAFIAGAAGYGIDRYKGRAANGKKRKPAVQFNDDIK